MNRPIGVAVDDTAVYCDFAAEPDFAEQPQIAVDQAAISSILSNQNVVARY